MPVNALEKEETRIEILVDGRLEDYHVERSSRETLVGNIYKGRVENVHGSLQAAFVGIGLERNSFLHVSEVHGPGETGRSRRPNRGPRPKRLIQDLIQPGQEVRCRSSGLEFGEKGRR
jgi:ribonuclease E